LRQIVNRFSVFARVMEGVSANAKGAAQLGDIPASFAHSLPGGGERGTVLTAYCGAAFSMGLGRRV